jgi:DNA polymerase III sliding clamp (beta) subunit (PCNA family)
MIFNREDLLSILLAVKPGVATADTTTEFANFVFTGNEVCTFNDLISVNVPMETDFVGLVNANLLYNILSSMDGEQVDISMEDKEKEKLKIKTKTSEAKIALGVEELEINQILEKHNSIKKEWKPLPPDYVNGLSLCVLGATKDETQGPYTCIKTDDEKLISSDGIGNKVSMYLIEGHMPHFLIKKGAADSLCKSGLDVKEYSLSESWIFFRTKEGVVFSTKLWGGEFLDWERVFEELDGIRLKIPENLYKYINLASIVTADEAMDKTIDIKLKEDLLIVSAQTEKGKIVNKLEVKYNGEVVEFSINPLFLQEFLSGRDIKSMIIGDRQIIFRSGGFYYCIAMRI